MSDLARTLAFAYRRKGTDTLPGHELQLLLAFDLRWFAPEDAKRVVQRALDVGLLERDGDALRVPFDLAAIAIPLNFKPGPHVLEEDAPTLPRRAAGAAGLARPAAGGPPGAHPAPAAGPAPAPLAPPPPAGAAEDRPAPPARAADDPLERAAEDERRRRGLLLRLDAARLVVRRRAGEDVTEAAAALEAELLAVGGRAPGAAP